MNNDGCDVLYFPKDEKATVEAFLAKRTTPLAGTHVGTHRLLPDQFRVQLLHARHQGRHGADAVRERVRHSAQTRATSPRS